MQKFIKKNEKVALALSAINSYFIVGLASTYLLYFYTDILIVPVGFCTALMVFARVWDAINDPLMGLVIDRTSTKIGKMIPYLRYGALPMAISIILIFSPIPGTPVVKMIYASVTYIIFGMLYTMTDIPFWGMLSIITPDSDERASTLSFCATIGALGGVLPMAFIPILTSITSEKWSYFILAIIVGIFCFFTMINISRTAKERLTPVVSTDKFSANIKIAMKNKPMFLTLLSSLLACTRYLMQLAAIYVATYVVRIEGISSATMLLLMYAIVGVGMVVGMLSTPVLYKKLGYKAVFIGAGILSTVSLTLSYFIGYHILWLVFPLMSLGGIGLGVYNVITYPMVGDSLDYLEWKTGRRIEGFCFSLQSFVSKFNQAFAAITVSAGLFLIKFVQPVESGKPLEQAENVVKGIFAFVSLIPAIGFALSLIPMAFYDFHGTKKKEILKELEEIRALSAEINAIDAE